MLRANATSVLPFREHRELVKSNSSRLIGSHPQAILRVVLPQSNLIVGFNCGTNLGSRIAVFE
jgi:hypothetical protein